VTEVCNLLSAQEQSSQVDDRLDFSEKATQRGFAAPARQAGRHERTHASVGDLPKTVRPPEFLHPSAARCQGGRIAIPRAICASVSLLLSRQLVLERVAETRKRYFEAAQPILAAYGRGSPTLDGIQESLDLCLERLDKGHVEAVIDE
jgi:hypothetical protein